MKILTILASALLLFSCVAETPLTEPVPPGREQVTGEVVFLAELPAPTTVATRLVGSIPENTINDIHVLVFNPGDGKLVYKGIGKNLSVHQDAEKDNKVKFNATLPIGAAYDFMVLANMGDLLDGISVTAQPAKTKEDVMDITKDLDAGTKWYADPAKLPKPEMTAIPMWGELESSTTLAASNTVSFRLTRMLARVNVEYSPTNTTAARTFRLASVSVYNYSTVGAVVQNPTDNDPESSTYDPTTLPNGGYGTQTGSALVYNGGEDDGTFLNDSAKDLIYLFEAKHNGNTYHVPTGNSAWVNNPCLVIGGYYNPDGNFSGISSMTPTYYRVDFVTKDPGGNPLKDAWHSLRRNFSYNVTITDVSGEGFLTPNEALHSAPFGITANVLEWDERYTQNIMFDGVFFLSVNKDEFTFSRRAVSTKDAVGETNVVKIRTDYLVNKDKTDPESGWTATIEYTSDTNGEPDWLTIHPTAKPSNWNPRDVNEAYFTTSNNPGPTDRTATVWIKAGRLKYPIYITQKIMSLDVIDPDTNTPLADKTLRFVIPTASTWATGINDYTSPPGEFKVEWSPPARPVTITGQNNANGAFEPEWITGGSTFPAPRAYGVTSAPDERQMPAQIDGRTVAFEEFTVQPETVTKAMLTDDPFYEKNTTYYFNLTNSAGTETITDSVELRSIHYDIVADTQKYRLDGGVHSLTVRSNADWKIISIEEHLYNSPTPTPRPLNGDPIMIDFRYAYDNMKDGLEFGPNVNGTALAFHVVDNESAEHDGKWGTAYVTLEMTTPQGLTKTIKVPMQFPAASKLLLGMGYVDFQYATNVGVGTAATKLSAFQMLSSPYNFGSMDESTYKVEGFRIVGYEARGESSSTVNSLDPDRSWDITSLANWLNNQSPDVIVVSSYHDGSAVRFNDNEMRLLNDYLDHGGAVILCDTGGAASDHDRYIGRLMESFFGLVGSETRTTGSYRVGQFTDGLNGGNATTTDVRRWTLPDSGGTLKFENIDDPVLNGPFGRVQDTYWGTHYYRAGVKTSLIEEWVVPLSKGTEYTTGAHGNNDYTTIFRHRTKNLIWIGCDSFVATNYKAFLTTYPNLSPFMTDVNNFYKPIPRPGYGASGSGGFHTDVYNSVFFANAVAWSLDHSNHQPPELGYQNQ